jgi:hypothetical protein
MNRQCNLPSIVSKMMRSLKSTIVCLQHGVFVPSPFADVPLNEKKITSTWAIEHQAGGTTRDLLAAHGFKRVPGIHFDPDTRSSQCDATIRTSFVLAIVAGHTIHVVEVPTAFLKERI